MVFMHYSFIACFYQTRLIQVSRKKIKYFLIFLLILKKNLKFFTKMSLLSRIKIQSFENPQEERTSKFGRMMSNRTKRNEFKCFLMLFEVVFNVHNDVNWFISIQNFMVRTFMLTRFNIQFFMSQN